MKKMGRACFERMQAEQKELADTIGARGAECLRNSTGVEAQEGGALLTVICAKEREQIWRMEEE